MRILDRYLIKHYLIPTFYCTLALIFLVLVADVFDNLDEFLRNHVTLRQALRYYLNMVPFVYTQVIQWASFIGVLYLLANLNFHNELTAMKVAGLEITTIIRPLVFAGFAIGIATFIINDRLVPPTYKIAKQIQEERIERKREKKERKILHNITYYANQDKLYFAKTVSTEKKRMKDFIILWLDENKTARKKAIAQEARWNGEFWELKKVNEFEITPGRLLEEPVFYETKVYPEITETVEDLERSAVETRFVSYKELKEYLRRLKENGLKPYPELVDLYDRLASPWNSLIIMFIAFPFLAKTATRKSVAINVLVCLGCVFAFHVSNAVFLALGKSGKLFPFLSAWLGSFLYGFGSLFFIEHANH